MSVDDILQKAQALSPEDQARVVDALLAMMRRPNPAIEAAWAVEIDRRVRDVETGAVKLIPAEEIFAKLRQRR